MNEYQKTYIALQKQFRVTQGNPDSVRALYDFKEKLEQFFHCEASSKEEDQAEAASLYAEYAMDFATQAMQYALIVALTAMDLQRNAEEKKEE